MKKIILTEQQTGKLLNKILDEQVPSVRATEYSLDDGRYHITVDCEFDNYRSTYKSGEIYDIPNIKFDVSYLIDISHESYGINDISIYDIKGPKEIKTIIEYYPWDNKPEDKSITEPLTLFLDWRKLDIDKDYEMEYFGVDKKIMVYVVNDGEGGLKVKQISVTLKEF